MTSTRFEGIVIGHEDRGDADRLISFYTPQLGKVETVARGIRHEKSKLKGHVELLTRGMFMIAQNRGRGVLTDAVASETYPALRARYETAVLGNAVADFYNSYVFPRAVDEALWEVLTQTVEHLASQEFASLERLRATFHNFAASFVRQLGYLGHLRQTKNFIDVKNDDAAITLREFDALLAHTDVAGPSFSAVAQMMGWDDK